ncbi:hypothetical protein [Micromonospora wenchangensis]|uniref:hypothetical protein n=1 Tax=Micromonospora wenchangensis TaxID=1185415 RepID=UPI0037FCF5E6
MNELVPAAFGATVTLVAVAVQHLLGQRQQRAARLHDSKITLYADVFADLTATEHVLEDITTSFGTPGAMRAPDRASTGGRIHLLAPPQAVEAWNRYVRATGSLELYVRESGIRLDAGDHMDEDDELVLEMRAAIAGVRRTVRADLR